MKCIRPESDYENLRMAARESIEEGWAMQAVEKLSRKARDRRADLVEKMVAQRQLADGYYSWISYLLWMSAIHDIAPFRDLTASEAEGLSIVRIARTEFMNSHPQCFKCGARNDKHALMCRECNHSFRD